MAGHPSGRPIRPAIVKGYSQLRGTLRGFVTSRLNKDEPETTDLGTYIGFMMNRETVDDGTMTKRRRKDMN